MKIYLMGIGGTGMASLAGMLKEKGHEVLGSDEGVYPPMSELLASLEIPVLTPFASENLPQEVDQVIVGNVISRPNVEAQALLSSDLSYLSMPQAIHDFLLPGKRSLVVAGTHGKTTTSSLLAWVLTSSGRDPSLFVGGKPNNFESNYELGEGDFFVLEGDEYDTAFFDKGPKFLHYAPECVLLTSVEFDHADIYDNLDQILVSFEKLLKIIPASGRLVANFDYETVRALSKNFAKDFISYGLKPELKGQVDYFAEILQASPRMGFRVWEKGEILSDFEWEMMGAHNVSNALGVIALCRHLSLSVEEIKEGLKTFRGVKRRQDFLGEVRGIYVYDDFAHHPTAVQETLAGFKEKFPKQRLWAIFEPRSNSSKRAVFQKDYVQAFSKADQVVIAPVYRPDKVPDGKVLDVQALAKEIKERFKVEAYAPENLKTILELLIKKTQPGDICVFMSNGDFEALPRNFLRS
ncbi:MAG: UDP-N-acetylmuramate--L-alanine ligase [Deltaproteobacteria bacterium]|nr:UDP-N-acetylmuramate--L-alanine ligase [Deltaproteobacteria bacterium]